MFFNERYRFLDTISGTKNPSAIQMHQLNCYDENGLLKGIIKLCEHVTLERLNLRQIIHF